MSENNNIVQYVGRVITGLLTSDKNVRAIVYKTNDEGFSISCSKCDGRVTASISIAKLNGELYRMSRVALESAAKADIKRMLYEVEGALKLKGGRRYDAV